VLHAGAIVRQAGHRATLDEPAAWAHVDLGGERKLPFAFPLPIHAELDERERILRAPGLVGDLPVGHWPIGGKHDTPAAIWKPLLMRVAQVVR
jgi:hypothetical protein